MELRSLTTVLPADEGCRDLWSADERPHVILSAFSAEKKNCRFWEQWERSGKWDYFINPEIFGSPKINNQYDSWISYPAVFFSWLTWVDQSTIKIINGLMSDSKRMDIVSSNQPISHSQRFGENHKIGTLVSIWMFQLPEFTQIE